MSAAGGEIRILRFEVPVDDQPHEVAHHGGLLAVAARKPDVVEFWALDAGPRQTHLYRVFGTGQEVPESAQHRGTTLAASGELVWHLFELATDDWAGS